MSTTKSAGTGSSSAFPGPEANETFGRLKQLLREMFQLDRGDLDFGLYRVMNMKAGEINRFLDRDLLPQVKEVLAGIDVEERKTIETQLDGTLKQLSELKAPIENNPKVRELRARLEAAKADAAAEADVYGYLADFFGRYYREGDFMSLRRYSSGGRPTYLIPYDGEEVKASLGQCRPVLHQDNGELRLLCLRMWAGAGVARTLRDRGRRQREGQRQGGSRPTTPLRLDRWRRCNHNRWQ